MWMRQSKAAWPEYHKSEGQSGCARPAWGQHHNVRCYCWTWVNSQCGSHWALQHRPVPSLLGWDLQCPHSREWKIDCEGEHARSCGNLGQCKFSPLHVREWFETHQHIMVFMPPYSPFLNWGRFLCLEMGRCMITSPIIRCHYQRQWLFAVGTAHLRLVGLGRSMPKKISPLCVSAGKKSHVMLT